MSNGQVWETRKEIDCHSVNITWNVKCVTKKKHILGEQQETIRGD